MRTAEFMEVTAESDQSLEDAMRRALADTPRRVRQAWVDEQQVIVRDGRPTRFRVDLRLSFADSFAD